ncbi:Tetratricopeptide repeat protein [Planctomycetes bacterium K23_9]|uniref:Tetratricopeptide repeat protein n=2 Tax=Stieleria marina TaxID=1930275 RepID=A0A517NSL5_9BACT|nr:Tetratricopeptide repeat protein [Planctomycetes bacterium K23_9]
MGGKRFAFVGQLGGMNRREARNLIGSFGASVVGINTEPIDCVVIGADEPPLSETELLSDSILSKAAAGELEIISESDLWPRLGLVDDRHNDRQLYTPAMLADLLKVSVGVIRRWHRRGLITPVQTLHRLPYFDFQEVATARRLAHWIASGASPKAIEQRLVELVEVLPNIQRPLDQLSILVEGKQLLLRQGAGLLELGGQLRFDFDAVHVDQTAERVLSHQPSVHDDDDSPQVISFADAQLGHASSENRPSEPEVDDLLQGAYDAEDADDLDTAIDFCHAILARDGARAEISFQLAELLYRSGELIAARERYYAAIEIDPRFVEARASLGNVLAETGQGELSLAAYRGAISLHPGYVEAHFGIAKLLDKLGEAEQADVYWKEVIELSPHSPWAAEARIRLT